MIFFNIEEPMNDCDTFYVDLPKNEQVLAVSLREIVLSCSPDFREKLSYGVPYFFRNTRVCFIWPASVKYGPKEGVLFGLCRGAWLSNEQGLVEMGNRKEVGMIPILKPSDINQVAITQIIQEAILLDDEFRKKN